MGATVCNFDNFSDDASEKHRNTRAVCIARGVYTMEILVHDEIVHHSIAVNTSAFATLHIQMHVETTCYVTEGISM